MVPQGATCPLPVVTQSKRKEKQSLYSMANTLEKKSKILKHKIILLCVGDME